MLLDRVEHRLEEGWGCIAADVAVLEDKAGSQEEVDEREGDACSQRGDDDEVWVRLVSLQRAEASACNIRASQMGSVNVLSQTTRPPSDSPDQLSSWTSTCQAAGRTRPCST